ncbi:CAMK/CAMK-unique protein kinase [Coprinopsis sp. MPI-PUGE-AT-0042]|nr:CAMK/CAMK-unique protein kinase [Coprinopsis sp. MPI-PUGE-AT-0042]
MYTGPHYSDARSIFASPLPQGDDARGSYDFVVRDSAVPDTYGAVPTSQKVTDDDLLALDDDELDSEQKLSKAFDGPTARPSAIPATVSQASDIASSPAAMFLSAFMSPKAEPQALEDDEGQIVSGYTLGSIIGFGGFSTIRRATSDSGSLVAVKIIRGTDLIRTGHAPEERRKLQHEAKIWSTLSHEHILPLFSTVHTSYADYFITLYCPAGSLYDILKRDGHPALPQDDAGMMFRQVVRGLRYLHEEAALVHRDMKLENVLVDESGVCRIGDFGLSVRMGGEDEDILWPDQQEHAHDGYGGIHRTQSLNAAASKRPTKVTSINSAIARHHSTKHRNTTSAPLSHVHQPGSLPYAAPELLLPHTSEMQPTHPSQDIWALGVILYALLTGHLPFSDSFEPRLQMKILNGVFEIPSDIGRGAERVLLGCMERNMSKRWSISMVDEVAWGVGWGSAGDDATPEEALEEEEVSSQQRPCPPSITIPNPEDDDWQNEEQYPRSAIEAASRRSSSRAQRSQSRAPVSHRPSSGRSLSRQSRASSPPPPHSGARSRSRFYASELDSRDVSRDRSPVLSPMCYTDDMESRSRSQSRVRGRRPVRRSYFEPSRSPSPSMVPTTPDDISHQLMARLNLRDVSEELRLDSPRRGRARFNFNTESFNEGDETETDAKDLDPILAHTTQSPAEIPPGWTTPLSALDPREASLEARPAVEKRMSWQGASPFARRSRPGSIPPTPAASAKTWDIFRTNKPTKSAASPALSIPNVSRNGSSHDVLLVG